MDDRLLRRFLARLSPAETTDLSSWLGCAVACLEPEEVYCQVGCSSYRVGKIPRDGTTPPLLVSALSESPEALAYVVEDSDLDWEALADAIADAGLDDRVMFCAQSISDFFFDFQHLETREKIGVYLYDGANDYRSILLGLLFVRPFLADSALLVVRSHHLPVAHQAMSDFLASHPQCRRVSDSIFSDTVAVLQWTADSGRSRAWDWESIAQFRHDRVVRQLQHLKMDAPTVEQLFVMAVRDYENGNYSAAERGYRQILEREPQKFEAWFNLGMLYYTLDRGDAAVVALKRCLELEGDRANVYYGLGLVWEQVEDFDRATEAYRKSIELAPEFLDAYTNLGNVYYYQSQYQKAEEIYRRVIEKSRSFGGYLNLGNALMMQRRLEEAISAYQIAQSLDSDDKKLNYNLSIARIQKKLQLPVLYNSIQDIERSRKTFLNALDELIQKSSIENPDDRKTVLNQLSWHVNFFLAYQGRNDLEVQKKYGNFVHQVVAANFPDLVKPRSMPPRTEAGKFRIGYVTYFMKQSSIGKLCLGWLKHLDRSQFEIYAYHLGDKNDETTTVFQELSDIFRQSPYDRVEDIGRQILVDRLHALVFIDLGMYAKATILAAMRLAPIQCTTWCHPVTSGLPTLDYFLSSELMEPGDGDSHYSENLVRLPNIGVSFAKPNVPQPTQPRSHFHLTEDSIVYLSCQSLYKYLPQDDRIFAQIARRVANAQFVFLAHDNANVTEQFSRRLKRAFAELELDSDRFCTIVPRQDSIGYWNLNLTADVFLDSFSWSGGVTTLEAIACGLPIVTCPGEFMRGRHTYGILQMLRVTETIAATKDEYIDIAVRLGLDADWRQSIAAKVRENQNRVYDDRSCIEALEAFFQSSVIRYPSPEIET
ncbi:MAG: tetratricopeptide repeat protein [Cyanobacteria bacterium SID2]|nr:tetratricopeptide repeat protein [Cyanobacteria bacterium SID2]MBP0005990.1 tetratricopeptide repeat protein [Cyanobacteria bacterium SBC]